MNDCEHLLETLQKLADDELKITGQDMQILLEIQSPIKGRQAFMEASQNILYDTQHWFYLACKIWLCQTPPDSILDGIPMTLVWNETVSEGDFL